MSTTNIEPKNTYTFKNAYSDKMLNLYGGYTTDGTNVCQYTEDNSDEQKWTLGDDSKLYTYGSTDKCLDKYTSSSNAKNRNADIWTNSDNDNQKVTFVPTGSYVKIQLIGTSYFLTAYYGTANGGNTDDRKVPGATGNVYWADEDDVTDADQQKWLATLVNFSSSGNNEPEIEPENDLTEGYYRITTSSSSKKALNHYGAGGGITANLYTCDGTADQVWKLEGNKLYCESRSDYGLKANGTSVIVSPTPDVVEFNNTGAHLYTIKLTGTNYYLVESNGQVVWQTTSSPTSWRVERIIKQTGIPNKGTEYFSTDSGFNDGIWNSSYSNIVRNFYKKVYGVNAVNDANCFYNLYGALMYNAGSDTGKFHCGVDMKLYDGAPIKAPFSGKVTRISENYGRVYLYNQALNVTFVFLHMAISQNISKDDVISEGTIIGTQSGYGKNSSPDDFGSHLHVEIHTGEHDGGASVAPEYSYKPITSSKPYEWLGQV